MSWGPRKRRRKKGGKEKVRKEEGRVFVQFIYAHANNVLFDYKTSSSDSPFSSPSPG